MNPQDSEAINWSAKLWRGYLFLGVVLGIVALVFLLRIPTEAGGSIILGLTPTRLVFVIGLVSLMILFGWLLFRSWQKPHWFEKQINKLDQWLSRSSIWGSTFVVCLIIFLGGAYAILLTPEITEPFTRAYFERLVPIIFWFTGLSLQTIVILLILRAAVNPGQLLEKAKFVLIFALIIGFFFGLWSWIVGTQFESESKVLGWNETGAPVLEIQVLLAWVIGLAIVGLVGLLPRSRTRREAGWFSRFGIDVVLGIAIWLSAVFLWNSIPLTANWFLSEPAPPNFEYYPNSDALIYDMSAQQLLTGEGFQFQGTPFARRPFHTLYLAGLHSVAGQDYARVVTFQIAVLGMLPVVIYFLTKSIHQRFSGVIAAILILVREANAIAMAGTITSAHAKLLLVDLPATLCVVSFILVVVIWLKGGGQKSGWGLVAGGSLGICMLIRAEFGAMILTSLLVLAIYHWKCPVELVKSALLFLLGLSLLLSPWIWRNYQKTGQVFLDSPSFRVDDILTNIEQSPIGTQPAPEKEEGEISILPPTEVNPDVPSQPASTNRLVDFLLGNSREVSRYVLAHAVHSQLQVFLRLPTTFRPMDSLVGFIGHRDSQKLWEECCSTTQYPRRMPYWFQWDGTFPRQSLIPLILNMMIILTGIYIAWKNYRLIGIIPLLYALTHILAMALIRKSGGRYILPADWVGLVYFSIGLAGLTVRFLTLIWKKPVVDNPMLAIPPIIQGTPIQKQIWRQPVFYVTAIGIFLIGCSLPFVERMVYPQYREERKTEMLDSLLTSDLWSGSEEKHIMEMVSRNEVSVDAGRALFPRFYRAGIGEPGTSNPMGPLPYARLGFYLAGPTNKAFILPFIKKPTFFPNGSDVLVISNKDGEILALGIFETPEKIGDILVGNPNPGSD